MVILIGCGLWMFKYKKKGKTFYPNCLTPYRVRHTILTTIKLTLKHRPFSKRLDLALDLSQASLAPQLFWQLQVLCVYTLRVSDERAEPEAESKAQVVVSKMAIVLRVLFCTLLSTLYSFFFSNVTSNVTTRDWTPIWVSSHGRLTNWWYGEPHSWRRVESVRNSGRGYWN